MSEFYTRLHQACSENPDIPEYGKGRQTYISQQMGVSQEAVRKWFAGESKPKSAMGRKLAQLLGVDYVWLALGTSHGEIEKRKEVAGRQHASVYALMAYYVREGFSAAFDHDNEAVDIITIKQGMHNHVAVRNAVDSGSYLTVRFPSSSINDVSTIVSVEKEGSCINFDFLWVTEDVWAHHGIRDGAEMMLKFENPKGRQYKVAGTKLKCLCAEDK